MFSLLKRNYFLPYFCKSSLHSRHYLNRNITFTILNTSIVQFQFFLNFNLKLIFFLFHLHTRHFCLFFCDLSYDCFFLLQFRIIVNILCIVMQCLDTACTGDDTKFDGCNSCKCVNNNWACTKKICPDASLKSKRGIQTMKTCLCFYLPAFFLH